MPALLLALPNWFFPSFGPLIGAATAYAMMRLNRRYSEKKATEGDEKLWRDSRLAAEKSLRDTVNALEKTLTDTQNTDRQTNMQNTLKHEADLATVTGILSEFAKSQQLLSSVATESKNHGGRLDNHDTRLENFNASLDTLRDHIHQLAIRQTARE